MPCPRLLSLAMISLLAVSASTAQTLGDLAREEREKRNKKASSQKVFTNEELRSHSPDDVLKADYDLSRLRGVPDRPVVLVEFSDFSCRFCRGVAPALNELLAKYSGRVSLAYRDFPLVPLRDGLSKGRAAAEASRCAAEQGKFWQYHDLLFASSGISAENLRDSARRAGLDPRGFDSCFAGRKYKDQVEQDRQDGLSLGVSGTPCFSINGKMLQCGGYSTAEFVQIIEAGLAAARQKRPAR